MLQAQPPNDSVPPPTSPTDIFSRHLFLLHGTLRASVDRIISDVTALTALAPDAHLDDLDRRVSHLSDTVHAHCTVEDRTIFPTLQSVLDRVHTSSKARPPAVVYQPTAKRQRSASPVSVDLHDAQHDHNNITSAFVRLRHAIATLHMAPMLRNESGGDPAAAQERVAKLADTSSASSASSPTSNLTRGDHLPHVRDAASRLASTVRNHFSREEAHILPACTNLLTADQRGQLLKTVAQAAIADPNLVKTFRLVSDDDLASLFIAVSFYSTAPDMKRMADAVADVLPEKRWTTLCSKVPSLRSLVVPKLNPLVGILHMHKAIKTELDDIVAYCHGLDPGHFKQMQTLQTKLNFLSRVHRCHSAGEEAVLFKEMQGRMRELSSVATDDFHEEHDDEAALFKTFAQKRAELESRAQKAKGNVHQLTKLKKELTDAVQEIAAHLIQHMQDEETKLLPLVQKHFSVEDQDRMMRNVMAMVPPELVPDVIPWMFNSLNVNEQECMLRNLLRTTPRDEVCEVVGSIAKSVKKGLTERTKWGEICLRIPELEEEYQAIADMDEEDEGPVSEILRVHKAFRIEMNVLVRRSKELEAARTVPHPHTLESLAHGIAFLRRMVFDHAKAEDDIILPRLEKRVPGISETYHDDHSDERKLFQDLAQCLQDLQCAGEEEECCKLVTKFHGLAQTLRDEMVSHLEKEEAHMWPVLKQHFTVEEQSETVALIFGQMPGSRLRELLPWMIQMLSVSERDTMMNHIFQVTKSTLFETWLKTWLPLGDESDGARSDEDVNMEGDGDDAETGLQRTGSTGDVASTAMTLLNSRETMERTLKSIARDSSLSVEERTRMMQQVMLAPYRQVCTTRAEARRREGQSKTQKDDRQVTYTPNGDGANVLGCRHYERGCKLRAACCGVLYTCRLCHDEMEDHIMDRYATTEILCMRCDKLQAVSSRCVNESCALLFSRYFCEVCKFYSNKQDAEVYHCHSCNVCRLGKGLGKDFFHCMKCNQCMSMKYSKQGHVCVERAMESDCPVCHQFLFTSTQPVKYLRCGHLMHVSCFQMYAQQCVRCPVCSQSLEEMSPVFAMIDQQMAPGGVLEMPDVYRVARCDLYCLDCQECSRTQYHFLYNKCPLCSSYNTRVEHVDPNGGDDNNGTTT